MLPGKDRIFIALIDAVSLYRLILSCDEGFMLFLKPLLSFIKCHCILYFNYYQSLRHKSWPAIIAGTNMPDPIHHRTITIFSISANALKSSADTCPGHGA